MHHHEHHAGDNDKPSDSPERVPAPDSESTEGGQSGREIIPNAADESDHNESG